MIKLNQFKFKVIIIAFIKAQLKYNKLYFTIKEIFYIFEFNIYIKKRKEIYLIIFKAFTYLNIKAAYKDARFSNKLNLKLFFSI